MAQKETIVGVIGDKAQAIYGFQGTAVSDFELFSFAGQQEFVIEDNRRSTNKIVDVLNYLRDDISQNPLRGEPGEKPIIFVGTRDQAFAQAQAICGVEMLITLSRDNVTVNAMKRLYNVTIPTVNLLDKLYEKDNADRVKIIVRTIKSVELAFEKNFKEAIKQMEKSYSHINDKGLRRKTAFHQLSMLLSKRSTFTHQPLFNFYELVKANISTGMPTLTRGGARDFYDNHSYQQLAVFVDTDNEVLECKTIHKAKGDEFENVLVTLTGVQDTSYLTSPNLSIEEQRVRYVAISRARQRLFINVPALGASEEQHLSGLFDIKR